MGQMVDVRCRECGVTSEQIDGPLMMGFLPRCVQCGQSRAVSITDLVDSDPPGLQPAGREAWDLRYARMTQLAGPCACGGHFTLDAPIRCPGCRSLDIETTVVGTAD